MYALTMRMPPNDSREAAGNFRGDFSSIAKQRTKLAERDDHSDRKHGEHDDADQRELPVEVEQHAQRNDGRHQTADQLHQPGTDEIPDSVGVVHDARNQDAGLGRIEVARRQPGDVPLQAHPHVGDGALRGDPEHLRQRKRRRGVNDGRGAGRQRQRHEQIRPAAADDIVDEKLGAGGKDEAGQAVDEHQDQAEGEPAPMGPYQLPGFCPGVRDVRLALLCLGHSLLRRKIGRQAPADLKVGTTDSRVQ